MALKQATMFRITLIYIVFMLWTAAILGKVVYMKTIEKEKWEKKSESITLKMFNVESLRGEILACDKRILATSVPYFDIRFDPLADGLITEKYKDQFDKDLDSLSLCLSNLFRDRTKEQYKNEILSARRNKNRNFLIKRTVDYNQLQALKKFPIFRKGRNGGGLKIEQDNRRIYPFGDLAYRTLGYVSKVDSLVGIEGSFDTYLKGTDGRQLRRKISGGDWMPLRDGMEVEPKDGKSIVTTLDVNIQDIAQTELEKQLIEKGAHHGSVIVMETKTGAIRAIASLQKYSAGAYREVFNYAIAESVEPGSTFKLASYMALLEDGYIKPTDSIDNKNGTFAYRGKSFHDDGRASTKGIITVEEAFAHSSNPAIAQLVLKHYSGKEEQFYNKIAGFGLNKKLGLQISGEASTFIQNPNTKNKALGWSALSLPQMSTGYEVRLAPIHTLTFYNAIANNGKMVKPRFVESIIYQNRTEETFGVEVLNNSICSAHTLKSIKSMLKAVVEYGTAKNIKSDKYEIAGKTGTAQIASGVGGYTVNKRHYASFAGFFPADDPKYTCVITIYAPSIGSTGGGAAAAPVFKSISDRIFAMEKNLFPDISTIGYNEEKTAPASKSGNIKDLKLAFKGMDISYKDDAGKSEWGTVVIEGEDIIIKERDISSGFIPDVRDMGLMDAVYLLESAGLSVNIKGKGRVISQSPVPGTKISNGGRINIELK